MVIASGVGSRMRFLPEGVDGRSRRKGVDFGVWEVIFWKYIFDGLRSENWVAMCISLFNSLTDAKLVNFFLTPNASQILT